MILNAQPKQLTLKDDGQIYFQPDASNPLPGSAVAQLVKGESLLQPAVQFMLPDDQNNDDTKTFISNWLKAHLYTVLQPLFAMVDDENIPESVNKIFIHLFQNLGVAKRADLEESITALDTEQRKTIRQKKVKLGPILVFLPELNKPAAVKLRGLLLGLQNDLSLPVPCPRDGAVSVKIDVATADADFYRSIGYPIYADRAIRIDMLDRVISAVYDSADKGKFRAQHSFAEWMGCGIADLYAILTAMGHKQIEKPVEEVVVTEVVEPAPVTEGEVVEVAEATEATPPAQKPKPELDEFHLRKGLAHRERAAFGPRAQKPSREFSTNDKDGAQKPPFKKRNENDEKSFGGKKFASQKDGKFNKRDDRDNRDRKPSQKQDRAPRNDEPRVYSAAAKTSDNPFAVLQQLKTK
jgi:ATP-dependent RNA helicase SUPV3L1/SUV3